MKAGDSGNQVAAKVNLSDKIGEALDPIVTAGLNKAKSVFLSHGKSLDLEDTFANEKIVPG